MNQNNAWQANAKVLLFGEYTVLLNSMALSIPFRKFSGRLLTLSETGFAAQRRSHEDLRNFFSYLKTCESAWKAPFSLDLEWMGQELENGLWFDSNIPRGYGLGSSGALIAAIFQKYGYENDRTYFIDKGLLSPLRDFLASLESYFHGKSSGLDPMVSFINRPLLAEPGNRIRIIENKWHDAKGKGALFLLDSDMTCDTGPLVAYFREQCDDQEYRQKLEERYLPMVTEAVHSYLTADSSKLMENVLEISEFQRVNMEKMIPRAMAVLWKKGLEKDLFAMKLCGSGGGGMFLGFTPDMDRMLRELPDLSPVIVHRL